MLGVDGVPGNPGVIAAMAAAASVVGSTLPAQHATLRGSEASRAIGEDLMKNIAETVERTFESSSNNEMSEVLSTAGAKGLEALIVQAGIAGATMAGKAVARSCQRRRPSEQKPKGDEAKIAAESENIKNAILRFKEEYGKSPNGSTPTRPLDLDTPDHGPLYHDLTPRGNMSNQSESCSL